MESASTKNEILAAWEQILAIRAADPAIFTVEKAVLRTFSDIEAESIEIAKNLAAFQTGEVVAVQIGNKPSWPAIFLACLRQRLVVLPLGTHIERTEFESAAATCQIRGVIRFENGALTYTSIGPMGHMEPIGPILPAPDLLKLTSGTTSAPRAIRFRAGQLLADCENICDTMGFGPADLNFGVIPFSHSYGFSNLITPLLCRGVPLVCSEDRLPRAILNGLAASGATVFPGMPVFYQKLADLENAPALPALRLCISAGAPLLKSVAAPFTEKYGLKIHTFYGSSECGGIAYDATDEPIYEDGFVGQPMKNVVIDLTERVDDASRIEIKSAAVGDGYFPTADVEVLGEGRFRPADLIEQTPRGLRVVGRVSDVINVAGRKLNPMEVEVQLLKFPGVKQAIVFGIPSALRHEEAVACITGDATAHDLLAYCHTVLSAWQVPKDIWLVNEIPVSERGKISRRELAKHYLATK